MDPNETLEQLRKLFADEEEATSPHLTALAFEEARDLFQALDGWIASGGFLPDAWKQAGRS